MRYECRMPRLLPIFIIAATVAVVGHFTQWFGFTRPAIEKVRTETNTRIDATNADVAANAARIAATEQKSARLEAATREHAKQIAAVDERTQDAAKAAAEANRATNDDVAKLAERVDANTRAIGEMKAQIAAATPNAEEQQLRRDLMNAMSAASQFKAAVAEFMQTEGRMPAGNAQVGLLAPERYADGGLLRLAIEQGTIAAYFRGGSGGSANPRFRLIPDGPDNNPAGVVRWKCDTNLLLAARLFTSCELKPAP